MNSVDGQTNQPNLIVNYKRGTLTERGKGDAITIHSDGVSIQGRRDLLLCVKS